MPEYVDNEGLERAIRRFADAWTPHDYAAVYPVLSRDLQARISAKEFDSLMADVAQRFMKIVEVRRVQPPRLVVFYTADIRATRFFRWKMTMAFGPQIDRGEFIRLPLRREMGRREGRWVPS